MEISMDVLLNTKIELPYDSAITFLGIYPKECKSKYDRDTCTATFKAAIFTMAKIWNQPNQLMSE
jgi:hypothetical protein